MVKKKSAQRRSAQRAPKLPAEGSAEAGSPRRAPVAAPQRLWATVRSWWPLLAVAAALSTLAVVAVARTDDGRDDATREGASRGIEHFDVRVLHAYPHDPEAFTQGLLWHERHLFESTGQYGASSVRKVVLTTGEVLQRRNDDAMMFGEGLARVRDRLVQLSWMEHVAHVWSLRDLAPVRTFEYEGEGWGLCFDGAQLVMSNGSDRLVFRDPETFAVVRSVRVRDGRGSVDQLNELECVDGVVWANVWQTDRIVRIDPRDGRVTGIVDASGLLTEPERAQADVLNGIAWIPERRHFVLTGKLWPRTFEVEFVPRETR